MIKKNCLIKINFFLCFLVMFFFTPTLAKSQEILSDNTAVKQQPSFECHFSFQETSPTMTQSINLAFGRVVTVLDKILFYQPFTVAQKNPDNTLKMREISVQDTTGNVLPLVYFYEKVAENKVILDKSASACLSKRGAVQTFENKPVLTTWQLNSENKFVFTTPFIKPNAVYAKTRQHDFLQSKDFLKLTSQTEPQTTGVPLIVLILFGGGVFYTVFYRLINFRQFFHAIKITCGTYDDPKDPGEISHFQALSSALSATVGLGNIAGVAIAVERGGPGAVFWMILLGFLGMASKFHECTLAQLYRKIDANGSVHGGPMYYLEIGFKNFGFKFLGKILGVIFAIFCIGGAFGGGNMFQANQCFTAIKEELPFLVGHDWLFGFFLATLVGIVILGGIKRVAKVASAVVPFMAVLYIGASLWVIFSHVDLLGPVVKSIFTEAFNFRAGFAGFLGVAVIGIGRAVFSNEAGIGSAAIAHSAARTKEPVREGIVALLEPFIDTVVICTMTALVVLITNVYQNPLAGSGVEMTRYAFAGVISWFPTVLSFSVFLFAFSTLISWSYYGEKAWCYLFGETKVRAIIYRLIFLGFIVLGCVSSLSHVVDFSDYMMLSMAFPNILGGIWLSGKVWRHTKKYLQKLKAGEFDKQ